MAKFCWKCGSAVSEGAKFCRACGTTIPQKNVHQQPVQTYIQPPQQNQIVQTTNSTPVKKRKGKGIIIAAIVSSVVVMIGAGIAAVCVLGFKEGGWFRKKDNSTDSRYVFEDKDGTDKTDSGYGDTSGYAGTNTAAMLDYAKRLEEMGNMEAAAEIYARLDEAGRADMKDAVQDYRDDTRRLMLDALAGEDIYDALAD